MMGFQSLQYTLKNNLRVRNIYIRIFFAEFLGTFLLLSFGIGCTGQYVLSRTGYGEFLSVNIGWGLGVALGVWASIGVSGGHLNPAVTLAQVTIGKLPLVQLPIYWLAQYAGAFVASACVYGILYDALNDFDGGIRQVVGDNATAGIWATYPQPYLSTASGFGDQLFGTTLLVCCIMAIADSRNSQMPTGLIPLCCGFLVMAIGIAFGMNCGYAVNPARDFGPRLFTACAGWGSSVFTVYDYWFWVPLVAPHIGGICGAFLYIILVGIHMPEEEHSTDAKRNSIQLDAVMTISNSKEEQSNHIAH